MQELRQPAAFAVFGQSEFRRQAPQLGHPVFLGLVQGLQFLVHPIVFGYVAGRGKHSLHRAGLVPVDRGVIKHVGRATRHVANGQWVVGNRSLGQNRAITFVGLFRIGKISGKIAADQLFPDNARYHFRGLVHIRDLAAGADGHQRIEAGLDQTAGV